MRRRRRAAAALRGGPIGDEQPLSASEQRVGRAASARTGARRPAGLAAVGALMAALSAAPALAGPITSSSALPVAEGELIVRGQTKLLRATGDPSAADRDLTVWAVPTVLVYGATSRLALFGVFPYLDKDLRVTTPAGRLSRGASGFGDLRAFARYTVAQWDSPGETLRIAPLAGVEMPSGDDDERDALGRLPPPLQLGSGSWDPILGAALTWQTLPWELDSSLVYDLRTEAGGVERGDALRFDVSFQYRLWPRSLGPGVPAFLYAVAESELLWEDRDRVDGTRVRDSGGTTWFLAPGLQLVTRRVVAEAAVQLPAVQDLGGAGLHLDRRLPGGVLTRRRPFVGAVLVAALLAGALAARRAWFPSPSGPGYAFAGAFGRSGGGAGELHQPIGIAIAAGEIFVSDAGNDRIQVFDLAGRFLRSFGGSGAGHGRLRRPMHLAVRAGELYVADYGNDRVQVFSLAGEPLRSLGAPGTGPGELDAPAGVAVDGAGNVYVADFYNQRVQVLSRDGRFVGQLGATRTKGICAGRFNYPTDVALLPGGELVVADAYNDRVQVFSAEGAFLRKWGGPLALDVPGSWPGWFRVATAVHAAPDGTVFVADFYNARIQRFTAEGELLAVLGHGGEGDDALDRPTDVAVDGAGRAYVVDFGHDRIARFAPGRSGRARSSPQRAGRRGSATVPAMR